MMDINIEIEFIKSNGTITMVSNPNYISQHLGIALKEICIFLKLKSKDISDFVSEEQGFLKINVNNYEEELKGDLKIYANMLLYPNKKVTVDSKGFSFEEVKQLMHSFYIGLPTECYQYFLYKVNFEKLKIGD